MTRLRERLADGESLTLWDVQMMFKVSNRTARRDLYEMEDNWPVEREGRASGGGGEAVWYWSESD
jgi:DeoR/GlpR family transcriptional regulator of sugar metabolism